MTTEDLAITSAEGVRTISLNRPQDRNRLRRSTLTELHEAIVGAETDDRIVAMVLTGHGRVFSDGQDTADLEHVSDVENYIRETYNRTILALRQTTKPTVAALNGDAAGTGMALALACDERVAIPTAVLRPAFYSAGAVPHAGASYFLTEILGKDLALSWVLAEVPLAAASACRLGLIDEVVPAGELSTTARRRALNAANLL